MGQGAKAGREAQTSDARQPFHKAVCPRDGNRLAQTKANGLIRQYIPKSSPIKHLKDKDIDEITAKINTKPRKKLNFSTPIEEFFN